MNRTKTTCKEIKLISTMKYLSRLSPTKKIWESKGSRWWSSAFVPKSLVRIGRRISWLPLTKLAQVWHKSRRRRHCSKVPPFKCSCHRKLMEIISAKSSMVESLVTTVFALIFVTLSTDLLQAQPNTNQTTALKALLLTWMLKKSKKSAHGPADTLKNCTTAKVSVQTATIWPTITGAEPP